MEDRKTVGLALGSGSSRGWAHIGAIEALVENGIPVDLISGCSVGAFVGAVYASGGLDSLKQYVLNMDGQKFFSFYDILFSLSGFLDADKKVRELFFMHTETEYFYDLDIPLSMVAADLDSGTKVVLQSGKIIDGLRATMSVPGLFEPVMQKNRWLVDGGVVEPVPISVARAMGADVVIAVDLNIGAREKISMVAEKTPEPVPEPDKNDYKNDFLNKMARHYESAEHALKEKFNSLFDSEAPPNILETIMASIDIMQERITAINLAVDPPDILIQPGLSGIKKLDYDRVQYTIESGYKGMVGKMDEIKALL